MQSIGHFWLGLCFGRSSLRGSRRSAPRLRSDRSGVAADFGAVRRLRTGRSGRCGRGRGSESGWVRGWLRSWLGDWLRGALRGAASQPSVGCRSVHSISRSSYSSLHLSCPRLLSFLVTFLSSPPSPFLFLLSCFSFPRSPFLLFFSATLENIW